MDKSIPIPDDLWTRLLQKCTRASKGLRTSIRLNCGNVMEDMIIWGDGKILGKQADGMAGYHGSIDSSMLTFISQDIEAVQIPAFHFWERPKWITRERVDPSK